VPASKVYAPRYRAEWLVSSSTKPACPTRRDLLSAVGCLSGFCASKCAESHSRNSGNIRPCDCYGRFPCDTGHFMRLSRWFLISGCVGIFVSVVLATTSFIDDINPNLRLVLWPSIIAGMADPADLPEKFLVAAIMYGGNFLLYGLIGASIGIFFRPRLKNSK
jgi:hypothetical protein